MAKLVLTAEDELTERVILSLTVENGRAQVYGEGVFPVDKIIVYAELVRDVHILTLTDLHTVEVVFGDAVYALKYEVNVLSFFGGIKGSFIPPFVILKLFGFKDVFAHIKILGKIARTRKVELHAAGDGGFEAKRSFVCRFLALTAQFPGTV